MHRELGEIRVTKVILVPKGHVEVVVLGLRVLRYWSSKSQGDKVDGGVRGRNGDKGDTGAQGPKPDKGDRGPQGPSGSGDSADLSTVS